MRKKLSRDDILRILRDQMPYLKEKYGVERLAIFGSFAKGSQTSKSDIDIIVQLAKPIGLDFMELADFLEGILGRKVDLSTFDQLMRSKENQRYQHIVQDVERTMIYA
ncbi:TPA: nucleotidyltransferase [Candidatus Poribacteria bacterium]|nr:nucleotidyltransferase [Candidatus Poribacteria bacterium]